MTYKEPSRLVHKGVLRFGVLNVQACTFAAQYPKQKSYLCVNLNWSVQDVD